MKQKHIDALELNKILELLAAEAAIGDAKELALSIMPSSDPETVKRLLAETDEAVSLSARFGAPAFGRIRNMGVPLDMARAGAVLSMGQLLDIGELLRVTRSVSDWRANCEGVKADRMDTFFSRLSQNRYFEDKIFFTIKSEEEINDKASPELESIRKKIRSAELDIRDRLEKTVRSATYSKYLQDSVITMRDGRFVVPVKVEYRSEIPGLVHDTSASGATIFIEPMSVVELNNEIKVLKRREKDEIERILAELSAEAADFSDAMMRSYHALVNIDIIFAKASLAYKMRATMPRINDRPVIDLKNARHPLIDRSTVVPISVSLGEDYSVLVITGPNTGGKTVTLKTIGLLVLMAMCGLMIPADDGSSIFVFEDIFADIGDEQSIEQSLSTFSAHMTNIISILNRAGSRSLVLADELGAGTDPVEGAALATAILTRFMELGSLVAATTHYAELKSFAIETPGVCNASCEFDVDTLRPTYRLLIGLPGRSNAFAISRRLGLSPEIISGAQALVSEESRRFEKIVSRLEQERKRAETDAAAAAAIRSELEQKRRAENSKAEKFNAEKEKIIDAARREAQEIVDKARRESNELINKLEELKKAAAKSDAAGNLARARQEARSSMKKLESISDPVVGRDNGGYSLPRLPVAGDEVEIIDIGRRATVLEPADKAGQVLALAGIVKTRVPLSNLRLIEAKPQKQSASHSRGVTGVASRSERSAASELDLRGQSSDEAIMELERFIDGAVLSGIGTIWIIHGKGTGVLRKAVHAALKKNASVGNFRLGVYGEGEDGVTIAELK